MQLQKNKASSNKVSRWIWGTKTRQQLQQDVQVMVQESRHVITQPSNKQQ